MRKELLGWIYSGVEKDAEISVEADEDAVVAAVNDDDDDDVEHDGVEY